MYKNIFAISIFAVVSSTGGANATEYWKKETKPVVSVQSLKEVNLSIECSAGETLRSGGYLIDNNRIGAVVTASYPQTDVSWRVNIYNRTNTAKKWQVTLFALCSKP